MSRRHPNRHNRPGDRSQAELIAAGLELLAREAETIAAVEAQELELFHGAGYAGPVRTVEPPADPPRKVRCACVRCGFVIWLLPDEVGALHYTQRDGYVCGHHGRLMPFPKRRPEVAR